MVLGREGEGLHELVRQDCDHLLRIPMAGQVASLNVSAAGAVVMFEAARQRRAGLSGVGGAAEAEEARARRERVWVHEDEAVSLSRRLCGAARQRRSGRQRPKGMQAQGRMQSSAQSAGDEGGRRRSRRIRREGDFSRSDQDEPASKTQAKPGTTKATDEERAAVTFTAYDFDIHLAPREHTLAVRVRLDVRNDGDQPLGMFRCRFLLRSIGRA